MSRLAAIAIASLAVGTFGTDLAFRLSSPGDRIARVIAVGYRASSPDLGALDSDEAGYRWAERYGIDDASACPQYTASFVAGCKAWVREEAPAPAMAARSVPRR